MTKNRNGHTQRLIWLDMIEGGGVCIALPFLMFPTVKPVITLICLLGLSALWIVTGIFRKSPWALTPFNGAMLLVFVMTAAGTWLSAFPDLTLSKAAGLVIGFAMWRFLAYAARNKLRLRWAVVGFIILCAGMTVVGIVATDWPSKIPLLSEFVTLLPDQLLDLPETASTNHANQLGGTVLIYYPLVLSACIAAWYESQRWYIMACTGSAALLMTVLLILTQSRSTWIGALVSIFTLLVTWATLMQPSRKRMLLWGLGAGMVVMGIGVVLILGPDRLKVLIQEPRGMTALGALDTLAFRQEVWRWAVTAVGDFPFTGCGLGAYRRVVTLLYPMNVQMPDIAHAHNIFLQVALDIGLPGLVAYVALLGLMVWEAMKAARHPEFRTLAVGILGGTLALHAYGLMDALSLGSKPAIAFWYSLGLLSAIAHLRQELEQGTAQGADISN